MLNSLNVFPGKAIHSSLIPLCILSERCSLASPEYNVLLVVNLCFFVLSCHSLNNSGTYPDHYICTLVVFPFQHTVAAIFTKQPVNFRRCLTSWKMYRQYRNWEPFFQTRMLCIACLQNKSSLEHIAFPDLVSDDLNEW